MCRRWCAPAPGEAGGRHTSCPVVGVSSGKSQFHMGLTGPSRRQRSLLSGLLTFHQGQEKVLSFLETFWKIPSRTRSSTALCSTYGGDVAGIPTCQEPEDKHHLPSH